MSIKTDVASLEVLAKVYQSRNLKQTFSELVKTLHTQVSYFDWVGVYLNEGNHTVLQAATDMENNLNWEANSELKIPIQHTNRELGKIVVKSKQPVCFDLTDVSTLQTLAAEISERMSVN